MAGVSKAALTGTLGEQLAGLAVVVLCATMGGILIQILMKGIQFKSGKVGPIDIKPALTKIEIPPLVGMIIAGCLARNFLCEGYMQHYPEKYASIIRTVCLSIILLRGGMELDFTGKGLTVVLLTLCPQACEAIFSGLASRFIFGLPWPLCFALGFCLAAVSPAVLVPSLMILQKMEYGVKKGIPTTLIAASSFDDIIAISVFALFLTIAFSQASGGEDEEEVHILEELGFVGLQILGGLVCAFALGFCMKLFNKCDPKKTIWPKFFVTLLLAVSVPILCDMIIFVPEAKFIFVIFFGYSCFRVWGEDKPEHELAVFWMFWKKS